MRNTRCRMPSNLPTPGSSRALPFLGCLAWLTVVVGCANDFSSAVEDSGPSGSDAWGQTSFGTCTPGQDSDGDKIPDEVEGCSGKDSDGDKIPDYADTDSDGDNLLDVMEGTIDTNKDGTPDYKSKDSDGDGVEDGAEDLNHDGLLGCCLTKCGEKREGCVNEKNGCGKGQDCDRGFCKPQNAFLCSNGETDPKTKTTFPGLGPDKNLPTFVCHPAKETGNKGLKPLSFKRSSEGKWTVALEIAATYQDAKIDGKVAPEATACIDMSDPTAVVAGFVISYKATSTDVNTELQAILKRMNDLPGASKVEQLSSGSQVISHDGFPSIVSTHLRVELATGDKPPAVRNALVPKLLGKAVTGLPNPVYGNPLKVHIIKFSTLLRKDNRVLVMGAVASDERSSDPSLQTGIIQDDLSNGTGLAADTDRDTVHCDPFIPEATPVADIIWVVDESGSMLDNRKDVAANASNFFDRALKSGLDFRMGVTGVNINQNGRLCTEGPANDQYAKGGEDRFLLSTEKKAFEDCVNNPPGYEGGAEYGEKSAREAVKNHLPRKANDPTKIRPDATLVIIQATDEIPNSWTTEIGSGNLKVCKLPPANQSNVNTAVAPDLELYKGLSKEWGAQAKAVVHLIGGVCSNKCDADVEHGYNEIVQATGGITADVCQKDLGASLQVIIDSITGAASTMKLSYVPISSSVAVAVENTQVPRSRNKGFDFAASSRSVVFHNWPSPVGKTTVVSFRRFQDQGPIIE